MTEPASAFLDETQAQLVYFSSKSENTHRLACRLSAPGKRLPWRAGSAPVRALRPFVLMTPCFADASGRGAVPRPVIHFLNDPENRRLLRGVIASGNRNFGDTYALAGKIVSQKCRVPLLYTYELAGTDLDVEKIDTGLRKFLPQG